MDDINIKRANYVNGHTGRHKELNCDRCKNKGFYIDVTEENGITYESAVICECVKSAVPPEPERVAKPERQRKDLKRMDDELQEFFYRDLTTPGDRN